MLKNQSKGKSIVLVHQKEAQNVYEDNDSDNNDFELLKGGNSVGHRYKEDSRWRSEKRRRFNNDSDTDRYKSPPPHQCEGRRSLPVVFNDDSYRRRERRQRPEEGPGISRVRRERSVMPEAYHHDSRGHSGKDRLYKECTGQQYSWYSRDSPIRQTPCREERRGCTQSSKISLERPEP